MILEEKKGKKKTCRIANEDGELSAERGGTEGRRAMGSDTAAVAVAFVAVLIIVTTHDEVYYFCFSRLLINTVGLGQGAS